VNEEAEPLSIFRSPLWWAALAVGALLRTVGLWDQILLDDEIHAFIAVLDRGFPEILWHYRSADHCIPLTALLRLAMDAGVAPAEWMLRLPITAAGIALLVLVPRWLATRMGRRAAVVTAWVLAVAPVAIYYSRIMRPYMLVALTGCLAAGFFLRWWQTGDRWALGGYVALAGLTVYLHPVFAPFAFAPFAFVLWETRAGRREMERRWIGTIAAAIALAALVAAFLVPGWESFSAVLGEKPGAADFTQDTWRGLAMLVVGSSAPWFGWIGWTFIVRGGVLVARRQPAAARFGAILLLAQCLAILVTAPLGAAVPGIFLRYNIIPLVLVLIALGVGLATPPSAPLLRRAWPGVVVLYLLCWAATHPLRDPTLLTRGFGLSPEFLSFPDAPRPWTLGRPGPYAWLGSQGPGAVVETPVRLFPTDFVRPLRAWSEGHGRRVLVVPAHRPLRDPRLRLRSVVAADAAALLRSGARFVIVHTDPRRWIEPAAFTRTHGELRSRRADQLRQLGRKQSRQLHRAFGRPDNAGDGVEIWDLERLRQAGAQAAR
jgi:Dolichyl-phosphate-mannose-protein mannosyltransferase